MLRRAGPDDIAPIDTMIKAHPMQLLDRGADFLAEIATDPESRLFVWEEAGTFAGFSLVEHAYPQVKGLTNLAASANGRGLIVATLAEVFGPMGAHRLYLDVAHDNAPGIRAFERAGFRREGTMRECWLRAGGEWADCHAYSMLAREWQALQ